MAKPDCLIQLFGGLRVLAADETTLIADTLGTGSTPRLLHRVAVLLAYLALRLHAPPPREVIVEALWPGQDPLLARNSLSATLSLLRRSLAPVDSSPSGGSDGLFLTNRDQIGLNPDRVGTDVARFLALLDSADHAHSGKGAPPPRVRALLLEQATGLYRDGLMPGYYEDWLVREQERLRERYTEALRRMTAAWESAGDEEAAVRTAQRAVDADPLEEEAQQALFRLLAATGRTAAALAAYARWESLLEKDLGLAPPDAAQRLARQLREAASRPAPTPAPPPKAFPPAPPVSAPPATPEPAAVTEAAGEADREEPVGGAVPLGSPFYIERPTDARFFAALRRRDSIVLVKGAREVGKTSLLARGLREARQAGAQVVLTDFEALGDTAFASADSLFQSVAILLSDQLGYDDDPIARWSAERGPAMNLERYLLNSVLRGTTAPLVWGLDGVDRLFSVPFGGAAFSLFRSWHNRRALDPDGPWSRLTLAIAYATEAHLFISDPNQSPFNVGTRLSLDDFDRAQVGEVHARYGSPLKTTAGVDRFYALVGGQPYLVRRGFQEMARRAAETPGGGGAETLLAALESDPAAVDTLYRDHLGRLRRTLAGDADLTETVRAMATGGGSCPDQETLYRLRSAGILSGNAAASARFRCLLYARYLRRVLGEPD